MEEYVKRSLDHNIIDPDPEMLYTKRKVHRLVRIQENDLNETEILSDGGGSYLEKAPVFKRGEMDRHIGESPRKHISAV